MLQKLLFYIFYAGFLLKGFSQPVSLSYYAEICVVTSGPGSYVYEKFGHTAIRIKDPIQKIDWIYNYGIFDFRDPIFYPNFVMGYMQYQLVKYPFHLATRRAKIERRWMQQQVLNLNPVEKNNLFRLLEENVKPQNAKYLYDPFFINCATKPRDILQKVLGTSFTYSNKHNDHTKSIRDLMNEKIHPNTWGSFGMNIALGSVLDGIASDNQYLYLPDYLYYSIANSVINRDGKFVKMVTITQPITKYKKIVPEADGINPLIVSLLLLGICLWRTYRDIQKKTRSRYLDALLFFLHRNFGDSTVVFMFFYQPCSSIQLPYPMGLRPKSLDDILGYFP